MEAMDVALTFFRIAFAASVVVAALALAAATLNRLPRRVFYLVVLALETAAELNQSDAAYARQLRAGLSMPVIDVPLVVARSGLATSRMVADALSEAAS